MNKILIGHSKKLHILLSIILLMFYSINAGMLSDHPAYKPFLKAIKQRDTHKIQEIVYEQKNKQDFLNEGLRVAASENSPRIINYFLQQGAHKDAQDACGWTALHKAVRHEAFEAIQILLSINANVDALTWWCQVSPLFIAVEQGSFETVKLLVQAGARLDIKSYWLQKTVLHVAVEANNVNILKYLIHAGAPTNARDGANRTPFMIAASLGYTNLADILMAAGAEVTEKDIAYITEAQKGAEEACCDETECCDNTCCQDN